jgi:hypothetical protein
MVSTHTEPLRDEIALTICRSRNPWTRGVADPIVDPAEYDACCAVADEILAALDRRRTFVGWMSEQGLGFIAWESILPPSSDFGHTRRVYADRDSTTDQGRLRRDQP